MVAAGTSMHNGVPGPLPGQIERTYSPQPALQSRMLEFSYCGGRYVIDLGEAMDIIADLMTLQSESPHSVTQRFVRRNRRDTIVFDLEQCLAMWQNEVPGSKKTSFVMLDGKVGGSCVGILVPGVPSGLVPEGPDILRNAAQAGGRKARNAVTLINLEELVVDCLFRLGQGEQSGMPASL